VQHRDRTYIGGLQVGGGPGQRGAHREQGRVVHCVQHRDVITSVPSLQGGRKSGVNK
jgi:hypothetical protein